MTSVSDTSSSVDLVSVFAGRALIGRIGESEGFLHIYPHVSD